MFGGFQRQKAGVPISAAGMLRMICQRICATTSLGYVWEHLGSKKPVTDGAGATAYPFPGLLPLPPLLRPLPTRDSRFTTAVLRRYLCCQPFAHQGSTAYLLARCTKPAAGLSTPVCTACTPPNYRPADSRALWANEQHVAEPWLAPWEG
jgi:hypothetical protein